jgi:CRISPR-associated protein Cas2
MIVLIVERASASLRGELSRWMIEPKAGVFVGHLSAMVRDKLWEKTIAAAGRPAALMIWPSDTEQGFAIRVWGDTSREIVDFEGLSLVRLPRGIEQESCI